MTGKKHQKALKSRKGYESGRKGGASRQETSEKDTENRRYWEVEVVRRFLVASSSGQLCKTAVHSVQCAPPAHSTADESSENPPQIPPK